MNYRPSQILRLLTKILVAYAIVFSVVATLVLAVLVWQLAQPVLEVKSLRNKNPKESSYMAAVRKSLAKSSGNDSIIHQFVPFDSISEHLRTSVIASEDDAFYTHPGFDLSAILRAFEKNRTRGEIRYGGSTITQQLAKNLFLHNDRTFSRKAREMLYTLLLESYLGKERILELYLNYAQWGERVFGCEAAARKYFQKSCSALSLGEAARLSATLAKPVSLSPNNTSSIFLGKRLRVIADNLYMKNEIGPNGYRVLTGTPPPGADTTQSDTTIPD